MWRQWKALHLTRCAPSFQPRGCAWPYWCSAADLMGFQGFPRKVFPSLSPESVSCSKFGNLWHMWQRQYSGRFQVTFNRENTWPALSWRHLDIGKTMCLRLSGTSFLRTAGRAEFGEHIQHPTGMWLGCSLCSAAWGTLQRSWGWGVGTATACFREWQAFLGTLETEGGLHNQCHPRRTKGHGIINKM